MSTVVSPPAAVVAVANEILRAEAVDIIEPYPSRCAAKLVRYRPAYTAAATTRTHTMFLMSLSLCRRPIRGYGG